ncbi:MAG: alpha/beta hydrolase [Alphaproteobacteria bacterium]
MSDDALTELEPAPKPAKYYTPPLSLSVMGLPTAYRRKGSGEAVLFLHGAGMTRMWLPYYEAMAAKFDFIAPEHPGFGETPRPDWLSGMGDVVIHYHEFMARLDLDRVHLIGFSLGGWIAAELATTYPERFKSLTLMAPIGLRVDWAPLEDIFQVGPVRLWDKLFMNKSLIGDFAGDPGDLDEIVHGYGEGGTFARLAWSPRYNLQLNRRLGRVTCPALVVLPERDDLVPESIGLLYADLLPNARTARIKEAGHALIAEQPETIAGAVAAHIEGA